MSKLDVVILTRYPGETDAELRDRVLNLNWETRRHQKALKVLLYKLGVKSARALPGIFMTFGTMIIHPPGVYSNVKIS